MIDPKDIEGLQFHWKVESKVKVPGVRGYATIIKVTDSSLIEGDVMHYDRALTDQETLCVDKYLREKYKIK
jgi:hypothetical protein